MAMIKKGWGGYPRRPSRRKKLTVISGTQTQTKFRMEQAMGFALGLGFLVITVLLVVGVIVAAIRGSRGGSSSMGASTPQAAAGLTLNCPSCGKETEAARQVCSHCHTEL